MKKFLSFIFIVIISLLVVAETVASVQEKVAVGDGSVAQDGIALQAAADLGKVSADEASVVSGSNCGENATWAFDAATGTLSITGTGDMFNYNGTSPWNANLKGIRKIVIGEGITHISNFAFCFCDVLSSVTMPSTLKSIGEESFAYCETLTSVTIPANVTEIKNGAFESCSGLATITVEAVKPPVISDDVFDEIAYNAKFFVPAGSEAAYKADENWKEFFKDETGISGIEAAMERTKVKKVFKNGKLCMGNYTTAGQRVL